ncbi:mannose-6-phosphate isomerase [Paenibacillus hemerocallicola]|uniref:Mannose-6-phosphate isomerase n=1 Tax=Paenibacillus hemerocallicola TaxID=1172614 RepID=A0A5C4TDR6_9BACL|nr:mannose-6-phosphate isomerase [Paenibacillus hemerocallicola]TNJ66640.1 mannose-6-phosphate isomerase [Paenibacillus hemerocallicola]
MERSAAPWSKMPLKLHDDRVWRTYAGGKSLDAWRGAEVPQDSDRPELWVSSTVKAVNAGREHLPDEGMSKAVLPDGTAMPLKELIEADPVDFLGARHSAAYQSSPAILVKLLDSCERLTIQVHPDREFAKREFNSRFGKTEAWYILGGRTIDGQKPYVLLGFKEHVIKESWRLVFEEQRIPDMLNMLHKVEVEEGDVFLITGGLPHAIGSGCFLIEIQEPTDLTLRTERTTPRGVPLRDAACHQGIGFDRMLECFHYDRSDLEGALRRSKVMPEILAEHDGGRLTALIQAKHTDRFRMNRLAVSGTYTLEKPDEFTAAIVVSGKGTLEWANEDAHNGGIGRIEVKRGETLFLPAGLRAMTWSNAPDSEELIIVLCYPPHG